jgi:hypothetical protein
VTQGGGVLEALLVVLREAEAGEGEVAVGAEPRLDRSRAPDGRLDRVPVRAVLDDVDAQPPITPGCGWAGMRTPGTCRDSAMPPRAYQTDFQPSGNSSARIPAVPGRMLENATPLSDSTPRISMSRRSPGFAPWTWTGPAGGCMRVKSTWWSSVASSSSWTW